MGILAIVNIWACKMGGKLLLVYTELNINRCTWRLCFNLQLTQLRYIIWLTKCSLSPICFPSDSIKSSMFCPHCLVTSKCGFHVAFSTPWTVFNNQSLKPTSLELITHLERNQLFQKGMASPFSGYVVVLGDQNHREIIWHITFESCSPLKHFCTCICSSSPKIKILAFS